jgi:hypothetical protein
MGVVGAALRGFGKALSKKGSGKAIKSVPIAKRLTERRKDTEKLFKIRQAAGAKPVKGMSKAVSDTAAAHTKYDKAVAARDKKIKSHNRKVIGAGAATIGGAVGAMEVGKRKSPKFKKFIESDVVIKDGKLGLRPKKKK